MLPPRLVTQTDFNSAAEVSDLGAFLQFRRSTPHRSPWRRATFETLRRAKIAVRIEELKSRVRIALPSAHPYRKAMISMAGCIAAQGP